MRRCLRLGVVALGVFVPILTSTWNPIEASEHHHQAPPPVPTVPTYPTVYRASDDPRDLQVHVVGPAFDKLEIYFHDEMATERFEGQVNLHAGGVLLAPASGLGTFALRYGAGCDTFKVYGWKKGKAVPDASPPLTLSPGCPVRLEWVTSKVLKATTSDASCPPLYLRFDDADVPFQRFDEPTQSWRPL